jgi:hypothetical protein
VERQLHGIKPAVDQFLDPEMLIPIMALITNNFLHTCGPTIRG